MEAGGIGEDRVFVSGSKYIALSILLISCICFLLLIYYFILLYDNVYM